MARNTYLGMDGEHAFLLQYDFVSISWDLQKIPLSATMPLFNDRRINNKLSMKCFVAFYVSSTTNENITSEILEMKNEWTFVSWTVLVKEGRTCGRTLSKLGLNRGCIERV